MSTVGLSFGSATSGAGFDVTTTVTSILALESAVETPWKAQLATLKAQDTALSTLGTDLSALSTAVGSLTNFDGVLTAKQGSSSDTNVLTLTAASSAATAGSHSIKVTSLATTASQYSDSIPNASDTLSGTLSIQVGSGSAQDITLTSGSTLASLATTINTGSYGVTASIVRDSSGSRLSLVSATSGATGALTLGGGITDSTTSTAVNFTTGQQAADAQLTVDGLPTTSASNTVTGAIPGVTFQLLSSAPGTTVQVQVTNDNSSIETAVQSVVTAYNQVVTDLTTQEGNDSTGAAEPLFGDPTLALLQNSLSSALNTGAASGSVKNIAQLGLSVGTDGKLTLDASTLDSVLNSNFNDVSGFLQGAGSFGLSFSATLNGLSSTSTTGALYLALQQNSTTESGLNKNVSDEDARVAEQKTVLTTELNTANQILQSIPEQLDEINKIYSAVTGYNSTQS